jgi:hypothetical protein
MAKEHSATGPTITIATGHDPITIDVGDSKVVTIRLEVSTNGSSYTKSEPPTPRQR